VAIAGGLRAGRAQEQASSMPFLLDGYDAFRQGLGALKADATAAHPVEHIQRTVRV